MGKYESGKATEFGGINIKARRGDSLNGIRFDAARSAQPSASTDMMVYVYGTSLYFWNGTSSVLLGEAAGGSQSIPSLDAIFQGDQTLNLAALSTLTIDRSSGNNNILTLTNTGAGSGVVLQITNVGTGSDVSGTGATWSFSKAGDMTANMAVFAGDAGSNSITLTAGDVLVSDGSLTIVDADDAATLSITNNTATTATIFKFIGSGTFTGSTTSSWMTLTASGLTSGTMVYMPAAALTTGKMIDIVPGSTQTSGAVLTVTSAATGITNTTGALAYFNHTGNQSTSGVLVGIASAAIDETVLLKVTASGALALGTAIAVSATSMTTGNGITVTADALTTGKGISIASSATAIATTGRMFLVSHTGATGTSAVLSEFITAATDETTVVKITTAAMIDGIALNIVGTTGMTTGSLIRATSSTAGAVATNGVYSFLGTGAFTSTAATLGLFHVAAATTVTGTIMSILGGAQTTGVGLYISDPGVVMTSGSLLRIVTATTDVVATNGIVSVRATGTFTSTTNAGLVDIQASAAVGAATLVNIKATAASQTATNLLNVVQSGATISAYTASVVSLVGAFSGNSSTGNVLSVTAVNTTAGDGVKLVNNALTVGAATLLNLSHTTSVLGAGTSMLRISSTGADTGTTTGTLLDLSQTAADGNVAVLLTDSSADVSARSLIKVNITNAAAVGAIPLEVQNAAVTGANSKFKKIGKFGSVTLYVGIDAGGNTGEGQLTGVAGDILFNGGSNKIEYCDADGTNWTTTV